MDGHVMIPFVNASKGGLSAIPPTHSLLWFTVLFLGEETELYATDRAHKFNEQES